MSYIATFLLGMFLMLALFGTFKFTPQVTSDDVQRAVSVCKEEKWQSINRIEIVCTDGAIYPRYDN